MDERTYIVEVYKENGNTMVHISAEGASGCKYKVHNPQDVGYLVGEYIENFNNGREN